VRPVRLVLALSLVAGVALVDGAALLGRAARADARDRGDEGFLAAASAHGLAEVKLSQLAMVKGQSVEVKSLASRMVQDHTKTNLELQQLAAKKGRALPTALGPEQQRVYDDLARLDGATFDTVYLRTMAVDHYDDVKLFQREAESGQDPELKSFAMRVLPVIEKHDELPRLRSRPVAK
jgi:putative membrane protein